MTTDPAVTAAAEALAEQLAAIDQAITSILALAMAAAEADLRERIAADIEALPPHVVLSRRAAAQIARGTA